ncbi:hypothetical protein PROFUN_16072 [Planoprotostelium fungivorum]|uniref:Uncharacterized protein n=1 Tax=Planoprotostelium fungivorum TaxID=1890364 RepID=A0A2P6MSN3_9EUKA|nr:hypothetical protein PROFUN_16072 [Planoprotostelium fungivorum]
MKLNVMLGYKVQTHTHIQYREEWKFCMVLYCDGEVNASYFPFAAALWKLVVFGQSLLLLLQCTTLLAARCTSVPFAALGASNNPFLLHNTIVDR